LQNRGNFEVLGWQKHPGFVILLEKVGFKKYYIGKVFYQITEVD